MNEFIFKIFKILNFNEKKNIFYMIFFMIIAAFLEVLSIGIIFPFINLIFSSDSNSLNSTFFNFSFLKKNLSINQLIFLLFALILIIFLIKNIYLLIFQWWHTLKINQIKVRLANTLFSKYLYKNLDFHLDNNSSKLIRNNHNEIMLFSKILSLIVVMISESLTTVAILILMFYVTPVGFIISVSILGFTSIILNQLFYKKIILWGTQRLFDSNESLKKLIEGFNGIKEIKNFRAEKFFLNKFNIFQSNLAALSVKVHILKYLPKILFEYMAIISFCLVFYYFLVIENKDYSSIISILILFVLAFARIMPAVNRFIVALQSFQNFYPSLNIIYNELKNVDNSKHFNKMQENRKILKFSNFVSLENINFTYPNTNKLIINNLNLKVNKGETIGLIGESGKGKTTLINIFLGLTKPDSGKIILDNKEIDEFPFFWDKSVGVVSQSVFLTDDTIMNNIAFGINENDINITKINEALNVAQLDKFVSNLAKGIHTVVGERGVKISGGQLQRLGIARALYHQPKLIIFDEATSQLDLETEKKIMDLIYSLKGDISLLIVSHKMSAIEKCDKIINLNDY